MPIASIAFSVDIRKIYNSNLCHCGSAVDVICFKCRWEKYGFSFRKKKLFIDTLTTGLDILAIRRYAPT